MTDTQLTTADVRRLLRNACAAAGSQKDWAETHGVSRAYLCDVLNGKKEPGEAICVHLGLIRVLHYVPSN